jgi:hypothetical protein
VILVPSSARCEEGAVRYTELQQLLAERDIHLHMLMQHDFRLKGAKAKSPKSNYMFGIDQAGIFTHKHGRQLVGDAELRAHVSSPKDICAALAEVSDGTVFSSNQMTNLKGQMQKKFVDILVRLWAKKAAPSPCQECDCTSERASGDSLAICRSCSMINPVFDLLPSFAFDNFDDSYEELGSIDSDEYEYEYEE